MDTDNTSPTSDASTHATPPSTGAAPADALAADGAQQAAADGTEALDEPGVRPNPNKRRRGSRGGRNRKKPGAAGTGGADSDDFDSDDTAVDGDDAAGDGDDGQPQESGAVGSRPGASSPSAARSPRATQPRPRQVSRSGDADSRAGDSGTQQSSAQQSVSQRPARQPKQAASADTTSAAQPAELPDRASEGKPSAEAGDKALVRRPQIGDTRPAPPPPPGPAVVAAKADGAAGEGGGAKKKRRRGGRGKKPAGSGAGGGGAGGSAAGPVKRPSQKPELDPDVLERRRGRERKGRPVGRYLMCVQVRPGLTQVAVLEGRTLIEHYVSRPADDIGQIHGNIYLGRVQNVLPGMEAAFVDIGTPKNAVLYRGDVQYDAEDIVEKADKGGLRIEQMLKAKQMVLCQVTKNPIGLKGARLTQEVSLPGRFVVLIPNSKTYGISKRLPDDVRKRLRNILDRVKPAEHGLIVRTAAENATEHELRADMTRLLDQWNKIEAKAKKSNSPTLLYREPELAVRVIREEFNAEYRGVVIDDPRLHEDVHSYVNDFNPELADRVEFYDAAEDGLPIFERHHIHEQLHKALDRKVWLPSGGSLIIEHTEALTVIDVNTGKNVGSTNLEETVFKNNLEAAEEVAKQLRLRDIGGIVVIDFIDMEIKDNRRKVVDSFRSALARDKTRTQVFDISELGLVEMTRKRIGEGLLVNFADQCPNCEGRGVMIDHALLE
jgi:ribonuclease E